MTLDVSISHEHPESIAIIVRLERTSHGHAEILGLFLRQPGKLCPQSLQVKTGNLLIQFLGAGYRRQVCSDFAASSIWARH